MLLGDINMRKVSRGGYGDLSWCHLAILLGVAAVVGCGSGSADSPQGSGVSLFQSTSYPTTAVLVGKDQKPVYLEALVN